METPHYRKLDLQSPLDLTYLHNNTVSLSRHKLDLHFPPSASTSSSTADPDPMRERVRELVDEYITKTFSSATPSITINGLDASSIEETLNEANDSTSSTRETIEYEPYDTRLAARVTALYAQLESLTTAVAKLRREAPAKAAAGYGEVLKGVLREDDNDEFCDYDDAAGEGDVEMGDSSREQQQQQQQQQQRQGREKRRADWELSFPLGNENEASRWREGEMAEVYEDALRTLLRLQGEVVSGEEIEGEDVEDSNAIATTMGKAERAGRAVEVVEKM